MSPRIANDLWNTGSNFMVRSWGFAALLTAGILGWVPAAQSQPPPSQSPQATGFFVRLVGEGGALATLSNDGSFGSAATDLDLRTAAGQDNLNFYSRWSSELHFAGRHAVIFLYQPLTTQGVFTPTQPVRFKGSEFAADRPIQTTFAFPFYRISYLYQLWDSARGHLSVGGSGQIRNANYSLTSSDGSTHASAKDIGFVPALKVRGQWELTPSVYVGVEADGIYAPISVLNGSDNDTVGAILDASVRVGVRLPHWSSAFLSIRYLGGGATNEDPDDYAKNWLHLVFLGIGATTDIAIGG